MLYSGALPILRREIRRRWRRHAFGAGRSPPGGTRRTAGTRLVIIIIICCRGAVFRAVVPPGRRRSRSNVADFAPRFSTTGAAARCLLTPLVLGPERRKHRRRNARTRVVTATRESLADAQQRVLLYHK